MRKNRFSLALLTLATVLSGTSALAAVSVPTGPTSLVAPGMTLKASSGQVGVFAFNLAQTAGETLTSVTVTVANSGTSTATGADLMSLQVYKDNGDGLFNSATDVVSGSQATVNVGSPTTIVTPLNNAIDGGKFFLTLATGASWSSAVAPVDSITVAMAADAIVTSANSPVVTAITTTAITADTVGPVLTGVVAKNTGGTSAKEAGDTIEFTFGEATGKPALTTATLPTTFTLSGGHSFLDGLGVLTSASWNAAGTVLTVTLSGNVSLPTVEPGDTVTVAGSLVADALGNTASGSQVIGGSFTVDNLSPQLMSAVAQNTGGTGLTEAGDSVVLTFSEPTTKPSITAANIGGTLTLSGGHSFLDGAGALGTTSWNAAGTILTVTLSAGTSLPTVVVGDTVTMAGSVVADAAGNPAIGNRVITGTFSVVDSAGPVLTFAIAKNTGGTSAFEAGDSLELYFGEPTNKPVFTPAALASTFALSGGHTLLDGAGTIGGATWNGSGTLLTITFSAGTALPTVALNDTVTVQGSLVTDVLGNVATGSKPITGTFGTISVPTRRGAMCLNGLINGRLYRIPNSNRVYLAAGCRLQAFRGAALWKARGNKFRDIITLTSLENINVKSSAFRDDRPKRDKDDDRREKEKNKNKGGDDDHDDDNDDDKGSKGQGRGNGKKDD